MAVNLEKYESQQDGANVALIETVGVNSRITFMGFNRENAESITIEMSITINGVTYKMIDFSSDTTTKDIVITDQFIIPAGSTVRIVTTGSPSGEVNAVVMLDQSIS